MARAGGFYSSLIAWLKILLPLAALALLSTLFLFSRSTDPVGAMPFAEALRGGETAREQVSAPYYAGTTDRGDVLSMTARRALPDGTDRIRADDLTATLSMRDGTQIELDALEALITNADRRAWLSGGVTIETSSGYSLLTESLVSAFDRSFAETGGPVSGSAPFGRLEAGRLRIEPAGAGDDIHLLFTEGVKLVYEPQLE